MNKNSLRGIGIKSSVNDIHANYFDEAISLPTEFLIKDTEDDNISNEQMEA